MSWLIGRRKRSGWNAAEPGGKMAPAPSEARLAGIARQTGRGKATARARRACFAFHILLAGLIPLAIAFAPIQENSTAPIVSAAAHAAPLDPLAAEFNRRQNLFNSRRYGDVVKQAAEFLDQMRSRFGEDSQAFVLAENMIISSYALADRAPDAVPYLEHKLAREQASNSEGAATLYNLGGAYNDLGRFREAEPLLKRVLAMLEKAPGPDGSPLRNTLGSLANTYSGLGRLEESKAVLRRELMYAESELGPDHPEVAGILDRLAQRYTYGSVEVEPMLVRALAILERHGIQNWYTEHVLGFLDAYYRSRGRYAEAESIIKRALALAEKKMPGSVPRFLGDLADLYRLMGRQSDGLPLAQRSVAVSEKLYGPEHANTATTLGRLAELYKDLGRYGDAEQLYLRAIAIFGRDADGVKALDRQISQHNTATSVSRLAELYLAQGRFAEAEPLLQRAVALYGVLGEWLSVGSVSGLGRVSQQAGRLDDAKAYHERAVAIAERTLPRDDPALAQALNDRAHFRAAIGDLPGALDSSRGAVRVGVALLGGNVSGGTLFEVAALRRHFETNLEILRRAQPKDLVEPATGNEAFGVAQWASQSAAATALGQLAARLASGGGALAQLVREQQDAANERRGLDKTLLEVVSQPVERRIAAREQDLRRRIAEADRRLAELNARITADFPDYASFARPQPLAVEEVRKLLGSDEALVFALPAEHESHIFAVTREGFEWKTIPLAGDELARKVAAFRRGLDVGALDRIYDKIDRTQAGQLFDLGLAHELYGTLLGPVEALIKDKPHLIVVPSGALTALPFHLLVTEQPAVAVPDEVSGYREAAWLIKRQAVSVLPSVASLTTLRGFARKDQGGKPLIGFGDPVFDPNERRGPPAQRTANRAAVAAVTTRGYGGFWQGTGIDRSRLSRLPRLPETADELKAVAERLGASPNDVHLRADANERTVKRLPLADYRIVYFATHGLVAGDVEGLAEPSLALTLPAKPTADDDGLLTASEVAQLKLNADWVVLSACNTIAGDKPGAEALSGLARAFFYAGARALLVSHWAVESSAATRLTTATFDIIKGDSRIGRAEALRRAMVAYLTDTSDPRRAYPALWAPFVVVGEGAGR